MSWNVRSSARKSGKPEAGVGVDDGGELDAAEVVPLRDHLRADEHGAIGGREALERLPHASGFATASASRRITSSSGTFAASSRSSRCVPAPIRASSADPHAGQSPGAGSRVPAVVAAQHPVAVQGERDVAVRAAARRAARAAVDGRRDAAPVQQQDRLAAALGERAELGEERRRQRVARLAAQVDDCTDGSGAREPAAELEPLERLPALRPRRRRPEDGDRALERRALRRHRARVVARVRLLLVRRVVLLVDADDAERRHRREHRRARADDDRRLARGDRARARRAAPPRVSAECRIATRSPKRARKRPSACGVSAISGTSTIAPRPRASAASQARMYTSVLPLPVAPQSRTLPPPPSSSASMRESAASCGGDSCVGAASAVSAVPTCRRSPRRFGCDGATSASARAGVEP